MGQGGLREILADIGSSTWFSRIADEATDISHNEQLSLSIRWVDSHYTIHEDSLDLLQLENTKASTIVLLGTSYFVVHCPLLSVEAKHLMEHQI